MSDYSRYDEYKMLIEDTARFTDRRQNASTLYTSVNSIFLAALSIIISDLDALPLYTIFAALVVIGAGIMTSLSWRDYILSYRKLTRLRFEVLKEIEQDIEMADSVKIYECEEKFYKNDEDKGLFTRIEQKLPETFIIIYGIAFIMVVISPFLGLE